jgi:transposase
MAMGRQTGHQGEMILTWDELPRSPGHVFYDRLQEVLRAAGFDAVVEDLCRPYYAAALGAPSLPPGRYFRMHLVGYSEGTPGLNPGASERGIEWRCADSLSLREFLGLGLRQRVPDHSWLSRTRARLPLEVHERVFAWVLARLAERGLVKGERIGVDASTMEANAAMRAIRRRDTGETYREMLTRMAQASGIATPTAAELKRLDRRRKGKRTSNAEWASPTDPEAKITRLKDGRTRLAYKPEHAVDLDTGAIIAAAIHPADRGDTTTPGGTLEAAARGLEAAGHAPRAEAPAELVADKGYHSRAVPKGLADGPWQTRIAEPKPKDIQRWHGDADARRAVYSNRARLRSGAAKEAFRLRAERVERSFAHTLDRGGLRRTWLRGRENVRKRYLVHVAGYNLGLILRALLGAGTPRELAARGGVLVWLADPEARVAILLILVPVAPPNPTSSTGC